MTISFLFASACRLEELIRCVAQGLNILPWLSLLIFFVKTDPQFNECCLADFSVHPVNSEGKNKWSILM